MPAPFPRTFRAFQDDDTGYVWLWVAVALGLLSAWTAWFTLGSVRVLERSEVARVEVDGAPQLIQASVSGSVAASHLVLGRQVRAGEVLVELDARAEQLALDEAASRRNAASAQLDFLRTELAAALEATQADRKAALVARAQARARRQQSSTHLRFAEEEARRLSGLPRGQVAEIQVLRAVSEKESRAASAEVSALDETRLLSVLRVGTSDRLAATAKLQREIAMLEGEVNTQSASMARLTHEIERRKLRSPVSGRLGDIAMLRDSTVVREGDHLARVIPHGELRVVAEFAQGTAVGRLRPSQPARVRLTGFNWAEYGTLSASVSSVGSEPHQDRVLVVLRLLGEAPERIPLQHGLSGVVEVEVEHATPLSLVLRAMGRYLAGADTASASAPDADSAPVSRRVR